MRIRRFTLSGFFGIPGLFLFGLIVAGLIGLRPAEVDAEERSAELTEAYEELRAKAARLRQQVQRLDSDNRSLTTQLAVQRQEKQILVERFRLAQQKWKESAAQFKQAQVGRKELEERLQMVQSAAQRRAGAVLTANNSVRRNLDVAVIPGLTVRQREDRIHISMPADQIFRAGSAQLLPGSAALLDLVVGAVRRYYPRQLVGIEAYADNASFSAAGVFHTPHQLTATQALTVFHQLTTSGRLPSRQLFIAGHGANQPAASNATDPGRAANRRLEIVIYPQTVDGN